MDRMAVVAKVREHFSAPGAELARDSARSACRYRWNGEPDSPVRCAFGVLIPDVMYRKEMEGTGAIVLLGEHPGLAAHLGVGSYGDMTFLERIQEIHDTSESVEEFLRRIQLWELIGFPRTPLSHSPHSPLICT